MGEVIDRVTRPHPDTPLVTTLDAVNAMVLNGLGLVNQLLYLVPRLFLDKPTSRLLAPVLIEAKPCNDEALGRAVETRDDDGVTARSSFIAATTAARLGLAPRLAHFDRTSFPGDGR
jgi:Domain of unknown function (DUF4277)